MGAGGRATVGMAFDTKSATSQWRPTSHYAESIPTLVQVLFFDDCTCRRGGSREIAKRKSAFVCIVNSDEK